MIKRIGFACKFMHDDQTIKKKLLEEIQNKEAVTKFSSPLSGKNLPFSTLSDKLKKKDKAKKQVKKKLPITKSELVKQLSKTYPNLLKKDLEKFFDIFINEVKLALKNDERVELRGWGVFSTKNQKSKTSRNPKTGEKVIVDEKKSINFKMSKDLFIEINNE